MHQWKTAREMLKTCLLVAFVPVLAGAAPPRAPQAPVESTAAGAVRPLLGYVLGPDDVIAIKAMDADEINGTAIRIDRSGHISLPLLGRVSVAGLTVQELETQLASRLRIYVRDPVVAVSVAEYRSQPVSVIGAVGQPGVHQLEGRKTLIEILAKAGGLRPEAGNAIKITRKAEWGTIPLASAVQDASGRFSVADVSLRAIMQATSPGDNIEIKPEDVISVPRADLVYVVGEVKKPGGFILHERGSISGLQAMALAEGLTMTAAPQNALIIRRAADGARIEIPANLRDILRGKKGDVTLLPEDILFVPTHGPKNAFLRAAQTAVQAATSAVVYRGLF